MGTDRSIDYAYRKWHQEHTHKAFEEGKKQRASNSWRKGAGKYHWEERAAAYDAWMIEEKQKIRRKLEQEELQKWEERARALRDRKWELSEELNKLCRRGFLYPLDQQIINQTDDGKQVVIVQPQKWTFRDMVAAAEASADLGDRALGKPDVDLITAIEVVIAEKVFPDEINTLLLEALDSGFEQWRDRIRDAIKEGGLNTNIIPTQTEE